MPSLGLSFLSRLHPNLCERPCSHLLVKYRLARLFTACQDLCFPHIRRCGSLAQSIVNGPKIAPSVMIQRSSKDEVLVLDFICVPAFENHD